MKFLHEMVDYLHNDKTYDVRSYIMEQIAKTPDSNKGYFWEKVLAKAMASHTTLIGGNAVGRDFTDGTDAKFATYYHLDNGLGDWQASITNVSTKVGPLRVCLCVPGDKFHKVHFMFIPYEAYQPYITGKKTALKFGLSPRGSPTCALSKYICSFEEVTQPYKALDIISE